MAIRTISDDDLSSGEKANTIRLRSYQEEMVAQSTKRNVIVAMDTGSGKTHIALARARAELDVCGPEKVLSRKSFDVHSLIATQLIWFLAPTVTLCIQQHILFRQYLPAFQTRLITSSENVDTWTEQHIWDSLLLNIRIVVSTPDVLAKALAHGFVSITQLALLIFDEAHHCTKNHGFTKIMNNFYHRVATRHPGAVPSILGLSASPVINAAPKSLEALERNLNSHVVVPKINRTDFIRNVNRPVLVLLRYEATNNAGHHQSSILNKLQSTFEDYEIESDPYIRDLLDRIRTGTDPNAIDQLTRAFKKESTYCKDQLKALNNRAQEILKQIGGQAAEAYVKQCVAKIMLSSDSDDFVTSFQWTEHERDHLHTLLQNIVDTEDLQNVALPNEHISKKADVLLKFLKEEHRKGFRGVIFADQRAIVAALTQLLASRSETSSNFQVGAFVGTSSYAARKKNIAELVDVGKQYQTLEEFRTGSRNLLVATSVLEEGIDVPECNVVICFDAPMNLKAFVQRRGRARQKSSKFVIMLPSDSADGFEAKWLELEETLKKQYEDDLREIEAVKKAELIDEDDDFNLYVQSTGALITSDNAVAHLYHFCATLKTGPYADHRPEFSFDVENDSIECEVTLPLAVDVSMRVFRSALRWKTERAARKDAAFQAYRGLYNGGLISENLLPLHGSADGQPEFTAIDKKPSMMSANPRMNPWIAIAQPFGNEQYTYRICLTSDTGESVSLLLITNGPLPHIPDYHLYWNENIKYTVFQELINTEAITADSVPSLQHATQHLLRTSIGNSVLQDAQDFVVLILPDSIIRSEVKNWIDITSGNVPAQDVDVVEAEDHPVHGRGLIRRQNERFILHRSIERKENGQDHPKGNLLLARKYPKRKDFLHPIHKSSQRNDAYTKLHELDASDCVIDRLPPNIQIATSFVPCILHRCEIYMVAEQLKRSILAPVEIEDTHLVLTAITATSAQENVNYQRMEFLGDCLLKFCSSIRVMARNLTWPESYLTEEKGRTISNGYLAKASLRAGLDKFIIRSNFTGAKWRPLYISDLTTKQHETEQEGIRDDMSSKTLADVVESLIGAAFLSNGNIHDALKCMETLLPQESWLSIPEANVILYSAASETWVATPTYFEPLERLIGHTFERKSLLLEALTHPSYSPPARCETTGSYQRLEFLGDAVLDYMISNKLYAHESQLPHYTMHTFRTSLVNGCLLAFLAFELSIEEIRHEPVKMSGQGSEPPELDARQVEKRLYQFLRHSSPLLPRASAAAYSRHQELRPQILHALAEGDEYPWVQLEQAQADKVFSDIVESVLGAIYIDTHGSFEACGKFIEKLGIFKILGRILASEIKCLHPKERLGHLAVNDKVTYIRVKRGGVDTAESEDGKQPMSMESGDKGSKQYVCRVKVGDREIGGEATGASRLETETLAAWRAVQILEGERMEVDDEVDDEVDGDVSPSEND